jgi:hypothetical protein
MLAVVEEAALLLWFNRLAAAAAADGRGTRSSILSGGMATTCIHGTVCFDGMRALGLDASGQAGIPASDCAVFLQQREGAVCRWRARAFVRFVRGVWAGAVPVALAAGAGGHWHSHTHSGAHTHAHNSQTSLHRI